MFLVGKMVLLIQGMENITLIVISAKNLVKKERIKKFAKQKLVMLVITKKYMM